MNRRKFLKVHHKRPFAVNTDGSSGIIRYCNTNSRRETIAHGRTSGVSKHPLPLLYLRSLESNYAGASIAADNPVIFLKVTKQRINKHIRINILIICMIFRQHRRILLYQIPAPLCPLGMLRHFHISPLIHLIKEL